MDELIDRQCFGGERLLVRLVVGHSIQLLELLGRRRLCQLMSHENVRLIQLVLLVLLEEVLPVMRSVVLSAKLGHNWWQLCLM